MRLKDNLRLFRREHSLHLTAALVYNTKFRVGSLPLHSGCSALSQLSSKCPSPLKKLIALDASFIEQNRGYNLSEKSWNLGS